MIDRAALLPLLSSISDFLLQADGSVKIAWNLSDQLIFTIVTSTDGSVTAVTDEQLRSLGLDGQPGFQVAFENLHRRIVGASWSQIEPGVFSATGGDNFTASWIAIGEIIGTAPVKGEAVYFVPSRSHLIVTSVGDELALTAAVEAAATIVYERKQSLSVQPLVRTSNGFAPLATQGALHDRLSGLLKAETAYDYDAQAARFQRSGGPVFQKIYVTQPPGKAWRSTVPWPFGFDTFLPKADWIFFKRGEEGPIEVPWDTGAAILGLTAVPGMLPPRYHTSGIVTDVQYAALIRAAGENR